MITGVLVVLVIPFLWSAAMAALKRMQALKNGPQYLDDKAEKRDLALMLLPIAMGGLVAVAARFVPMHLPVPVLPLAPMDEDTVTSVAPAAASVGVKASVDWLYWAVVTGITAYGAGLALHMTRLAMGLVRLGRLASTSWPAADWGEDVRLTPAKTTPLALGRATILIPESLLTCLSRVQMQMILRHEREHLRRGDSRWFIVLAAIDAILWFNPFIRRQTQTCRQAAELACDAAVVASAPEMRGTYAETLVRVLKHAAGDVRQYAPTAFSPEKPGDYRMRITEIMQPPGKTRKPRLIVAGIAAALIVPVGLAQFAWSQTAPAQLTGPAQLSVVPVPGPVNSPFGMRTNPVTHKWSMHEGVDFKAPKGTPVKAAGDGTVTRVYEERWHMGKIIQIDHGNGLTTLYTHLDSQKVAVGDHVTAGQVIATSGASGVSTGPHLHFEVQKDGKSIDPLPALGLKSVAYSNTEPSAPPILFKACGNTDASRCDFSSDHVGKAGDGVIVMTGSVRLHQGAQTVQADQVHWNTKTGALNLKGHIVAINTTATKAL